MQSILTALDLITPNCYMSSIDLVQAYYTVPVHSKQQNFLKFCWNDKYYKFICMPNGFCWAPAYFTLLTKPIIAHLHRLGHKNIFYLDDSLLVAETQEECLRNVIDTTELLNRLGFTVHPDKSSFIPDTKIVFLGFYIDSVTMTIELTQKRKTKILNACEFVYKNDNVTIRKLAALIGLMVSSMIAIPLGRLFYRNLERLKIKSMKIYGDWEQKITIPRECLGEITWWEQNLNSYVTPIHRDKPGMIITSDASMQGFGAVCQGKEVFSGHWNKEESVFHINKLEFLAAFYALKHYAKNFQGHVQLRLDNQCCINIINNMGTIKVFDLNQLCKQMWLWAYEKGIWISAVYVASANNEADKPSRKCLNDSEFMLNKDIFSKVIKTWEFTPDIDLFASHANKQLNNFVSFKPQPGATFVDAFTQSWRHLNFYAFPPFNLVLKTLRKIEIDHATGILIFPKWEAQPFWPLATSMMVGKPVLLSSRKNLLVHPTIPELQHRMKRLNLIMVLVSGDSQRRRDYQKNPTRST